MYLCWTTLRKSNEMNAYCCMPRALLYKSLNMVGLCSPANSFAWEEVTLWMSWTVFMSFFNVSALYIPYINMVLSNFINLLCCVSA